MHTAAGLNAYHTHDMMQDFGARDPTAGEVGSGFGSKSLGNWDTAHVIRFVAIFTAIMQS